MDTERRVKQHTDGSPRGASMHTIIPAVEREITTRNVKPTRGHSSRDRDSKTLFRTDRPEDRRDPVDTELQEIILGTKETTGDSRGIRLVPKEASLIGKEKRRKGHLRGWGHHKTLTEEEEALQRHTSRPNPTSKRIKSLE